MRCSGGQLMSGVSGSKKTFGGVMRVEIVDDGMF